MERQNIYTVLLDQQEEIQSYSDSFFIRRKEAELFDFDSKQAQVVIGVRRSGKSTLCHMVLNEHKVKYAYVNFDDDRLASIETEDLNTILETIYRIYGTDIRYIFFDEIQNVTGWHLFVNRLLRQNLHIFVTGSNAKLLSSELATHLTGRYNEIRLYPFSFREFCEFKKINPDIPTTKNIALQENALEGYLISGGFPEIEGISNRHAYVESLINAIVTKDIMTRFKIRNEHGLKTLVNHIINTVGQPVNISELSEEMKIGSDKTIRNYLNYLTQAFLILPLAKFSYKSKERLRGEKAYIIDTGILTYRHNTLSTENLGWRLENVVMVELLRRTSPLYQDIFYYRPNSNSREIDFVITEHGRVMELIQVALDISQPKTLNRELSSLSENSKKLRCEKLTLITLSNTRTVRHNDKDIRIVNAREWLLNQNPSYIG